MSPWNRRSPSPGKALRWSSSASGRVTASAPLVRPPLAPSEPTRRYARPSGPPRMRAVTPPRRSCPDATRGRSCSKRRRGRTCWSSRATGSRAAGIALGSTASLAVPPGDVPCAHRSASSPGRAVPGSDPRRDRRLGGRRASGPDQCSNRPAVRIARLLAEREPDTTRRSAADRGGRGEPHFRVRI